MKLRFAPQALEDIHEIRAYLLPRSTSGAEHVRLAIASTVDLLTQFPGIARDTDIKDVRVAVVVGYPYLLYHSLTEKEVIVIHIRHASRDAPIPNDLRTR